MQRKLILIYYTATALFLSLDFGFGINVRIAFLETTPGLRLGYYGVLFACLALVLWRPTWSRLVGTVESLATLVALIINMALRSMLISVEMLETGRGFVTIQEVVNFVIAGGIAYFAWTRGLSALIGRPEPD